MNRVDVVDLVVDLVDVDLDIDLVDVDLDVELVDVGLVDVGPAKFSGVRVGIGVGVWGSWDWGTRVTSCIFCDFTLTRVSFAPSITRSLA